MLNLQSSFCFRTSGLLATGYLSETNIIGLTPSKTKICGVLSFSQPNHCFVHNVSPVLAALLTGLSLSCKVNPFHLCWAVLFLASYLRICLCVCVCAKLGGGRLSCRLNPFHLRKTIFTRTSSPLEVQSHAHCAQANSRARLMSKKTQR